MNNEALVQELIDLGPVNFVEKYAPKMHQSMKEAWVIRASAAFIDSANFNRDDMQTLCVNLVKSNRK